MSGSINSNFHLQLSGPLRFAGKIWFLLYDCLCFCHLNITPPPDAAILIEGSKLKVPFRLSTVMEFEASFNDDTGLVAFSSIPALAVGVGDNTSNVGPLNLNGETEHFGVVFLRRLS